jgi:hypothetical protein
MTNEGILVANVVGVTLEAWKVNQAGKSAEKLWTVKTTNSYKSLITLPDGLLLAYHTNGVDIYDLKYGHLVQKDSVK